MEMENKIIFLKKVVKISTVSPTILQTFTGIGIAYMGKHGWICGAGKNLFTKGPQMSIT